MRCTMLFLYCLMLSFPAFSAEIEGKCPAVETELDRCPQPGGVLRTLEGNHSIQFKACAMCMESWSGIKLDSGKTYRITIKRVKNWSDDEVKLETPKEGLCGFKRHKDYDKNITWWTNVILVGIGPITRQVISEPWFRLLASIGTVEGETAPLVPIKEDPPKCEPGNKERNQSSYASGTFTPSISGELYVIPNDARWQSFYENNRGTMDLEVQKVSTVD